MFVFLSVLLVTIVAYLFRFHYEYGRAFYLSLKMNGPPALPIIGNGLLFINNDSAGMNGLQNIDEHLNCLLTTKGKSTYFIELKFLYL